MIEGRPSTMIIKELTDDLYGKTLSGIVCMPPAGGPEHIYSRVAESYVRPLAYVLHLGRIIQA